MNDADPSEANWFLKLGTSLGKNDRGWRIAIGVLCVFCLSFFLHFREMRLDVFELNTVADRYLVAQTNFEFPDYENTIILKQQAMQDVGPIYHLDAKQVSGQRDDLENTLIHTKGWRSAAPPCTFDEMYKAVDELEKRLESARFTDARTLHVVKDLSLPDNDLFEFIPEKSSPLPPEFWERMSQVIAESGSFHPEAIDYVMGTFKARNWDFFEDEMQERSIRTAVSKTVPEKFTRVAAGTLIVEPGERVTSRHITMMQAMKQAISDGRKIFDPLPILSSFLLAIVCVAISGMYFQMGKNAFFRSLQQISLFLCIIFITLLLAKMTEYALVKSASPLFERIRYPVIAPFAAILICTLLSDRIALYAAGFLSIILSVGLAVDSNRFLIMNLATSIVAIVCTRNVSKRKEVFSVCFKTWLCSVLVLYAFLLSESHYWAFSFVFDAGVSFCFLALTAILVIGLLPVLETFFSVLTDMTLMEYMDPNNALLQKMAIVVPGTYQHCLVLANLAESCASAIGANGLLCRAGTLYHDIGKIASPQFYSENQQAAINIHQLLTPLESAQVIISHVRDGEAIARKHHLPQPFIDLIRQHHGTTLAYYFYHKQLELKGGRKEEVDESEFRYPGPKPQTKEAAIMMICDSVEAASRSWEDVSEEALAGTIDQIVREKAEDGQFDECNLTFEELGRLKQKLVKSLLLTHHIRIKYPKK